MRTKFLFTTLLLFLCSTLLCGSNYVDGIWYEFDSDAKTATVTYKPYNNTTYYSGSIIIPTTVTFSNQTYNVIGIGEKAFAGCNVKSITIPNSVIDIGDEALSYCKSLTSIEIPNSVTSIGDAAFSNCSGLTSVIIGNSVTSIGDNAFEGCSSLTSVTIPNSVKSIGMSAFSNCSSLISITIPNSMTSIGSSAFSNCSGLTSVTIPNSVTSIGWSAFCYCSSLTSIEIPNSVKSIEDLAFKGCCGLTSISIPNSMASIGYYAFSGCSSLTSIVFISQTPPAIGVDCFENTTCIFQVPCGTTEAYHEALNANATISIDVSRIIEKITFSWSVESADIEKGSVTITHEPTNCEDLTLSFKAEAKDGYQFKQWSDGNTDNPRTVIINGDITLEAVFLEEHTGLENLEEQGARDKEQGHPRKVIIDGHLYILTPAGSLYDPTGIQL